MTAKKRLGEMLIEAGVIDESKLRAALGYQRQWGVRLGQALVEMKLATEPDVVRALAQRFGYEIAAVGAAGGYGLEQALKLVPREFAAKNNLVPLSADTATLTVAMSEPGNVAVADELRFRTGRRVKICIGGDKEIAEAIRRVYPGDHVEPIALDLEGDDAGEPVLDPFGGGSKDALEAFFGQQEAELTPDVAPPQPAPPAARPQPAPPAPAPAPQRAQAVVPVPAPPAPQPQPTRPSMPAAAAPRPPAPAPVPVQRPPPAQPPQPRQAPRAAAPAPGQPGPFLTPLDDLDLEVPPPPARPPPPRPAAAPPAARAPGPAASAPARIPTPPPMAPAAETVFTARRAPAAADPSALTPRELALLDALGKMAAGGPVEPELVKPAQAVAALLRILLRKKLVTEEELAEELSRR